MGKRERIISKYNGVCQICGKQTNSNSYWDYPELDHKIPRSAGGTNDEDNLSLLCSSCNNRKSNLYGVNRLKKIHEIIADSFDDFDKRVIEYEVKNQTILDGSIDLLIENIKSECERITQTLESIKGGNENG